MLWTVKQAAFFLGMEDHQVYYLAVMGEIEAIKIGKSCRLAPDAVEEYAKRYPERTNRKPAGDFIYTGDGGFLFRTLFDYLPENTRRAIARMERRRRKLVHSAQRPKTVLLEKHKPITQLELFTA
jgi:excisionase family DNA binding protein